MVCPRREQRTRRSRAAPPCRRAGRAQRPGSAACRPARHRRGPGRGGPAGEAAAGRRRRVHHAAARGPTPDRGGRRCDGLGDARHRARGRRRDSAARCSPTGRPLWSESYLEDTRFPHAAGTDSAAQSEQLGGILGVPLVVGDDTLGVLLAAERRPRAFVDHDVELLAGLAAHAALALRTADLFDRERAAASELRVGQRGAARRSSESRRRASDLRDVLNEVVLRGGGLPAVVAALDRAAGLVVEVRDADGRTLAGERLAARRSASSSRVRPARAGTAGDLRRRRRCTGRTPTRTTSPCGCCGSGPRRSRCCWHRSARWPRPSSAPAGSSCTRC